MSGNKLSSCNAFNLEVSKLLLFCDDFHEYINLLPNRPILGFFSSAANKDIMAKIWTNWDTVTCLSRKHCGKRRNCSL